MLRKYLLPLLAVFLLGFAVLHVLAAHRQLPKLPPPLDPPRTPYGRTVAGSGIAEPMTENISIGSALPGVVLEVFVPVDRVGQRVHQGDPLFKVDDRQLQSQLAYQQALLAAAEAQLAKLEAMPRKEEVPPSDAKVRVSEANLRMQQDLAERAKRLIPSHAMAAEDVQQRELMLEMARMQLAQAKAENQLLKAGAWIPDKQIAQAQIDQARAQVEQTKTDIDRTLVRAPVDGDVLQVNVRPGEYVGTPPSQALVVLGDIHRLHVRVDIDEHDIPRFQPEAPARASLRGNPDIQYPLKFVRVEPFVIPKKSLTGDNSERVDTRVLQVIYALVAPAGKPVYVGQQLDVFIDAAPVARKQGPAMPAGEG